jgi:D-3-phosphoglycerate dehydrogenase / 2-oxoglutarate reductase
VNPMGIGLFAPPPGLGLYGACLIGNVPVEATVRPILGSRRAVAVPARDRLHTRDQHRPAQGPRLLSPGVNSFSEDTMRVFVTHSPEMLANFYGERALAALREQASVRVNSTGRVLDNAADLVREAGDAQILVADRRTPVPEAVFRQLPDLLAVCRVAVDISTIDVEAASRHGVLVTQATPGFIPAVAELAIGMLVDLSRGISTAVAAYRAGQEPVMQPGRQLQDATLGIIGHGAIGQRLAEMALALRMRVLVTDPHRQVTAPELRQVPLPELLAHSDYVVCLAVSVPETRNLMNAAAFAAMRPGARFLNLSRGELVDEEALETALASGHLAGAALDVGCAPDQKPSPHLAVRPDVVATPHIAGLTPEATEHQAFDTVRQVAALVAGRLPDGAVNADAAYRWRGARLSDRR